MWLLCIVTPATCIWEPCFPIQWYMYFLNESVPIYVSPVPKSGNEEFLPCACFSSFGLKDFESALHRQLYVYFECNGLPNSAQSGFRPNHNTQDVVLMTRKLHWTMASLWKLWWLISIKHSILFTTRWKGTELARFTDYLNGWRQRVLLNGANTGVMWPRGSLKAPS